MESYSSAQVYVENFKEELKKFSPRNEYACMDANRFKNCINKNYKDKVIELCNKGGKDMGL